MIVKNNKLIYKLLNWKNFFLLFSLGIVASAQPDWSLISCLAASSCGYALFWLACLHFKTKKMRFVVAVMWFATLSVFHLNWLFADRYVGYYILIVLALLVIFLGIQFGLISLLIYPKDLTFRSLLGISGGWTLCEWSRLFILSGYTFDPIGISLTATIPGMQLASVCGIYGLSFWVIVTNLMAFRALTCRSCTYGVIWLLAALTPYVFGGLQLAWHGYHMEKSGTTLSALLVQPALIPEEKLPINGSTSYSLYEQWERVFRLLATYSKSGVDLIVFPEGFVPYGTHLALYETRAVSHMFNKYFNTQVTPQLGISERVNHSYWAQTLADVMKTDVVIGLEDVDLQEGANLAYNAAFLFKPHCPVITRYEKRVLVPMGEYIPFNWCKKILSKYGILDSYAAGKTATLFPTEQGLAGVSICYEETFGHLMREMVAQGAAMHINVTNDVWYPRSRLPMIHFLLGRLRAVEGGIPQLRACNTGVTCGLDALGRVVAALPFETSDEAAQLGVLNVKLPLYHFITLYSLWGDFPLISLSAFSLSWLFWRKRFKVNDLDTFTCTKTQT